ncbi:hypothetical protein BpKM390_39320 [Burkholderia pseudomallei]|nr:hypothetical protein [Burkholderia pseudomallei]BEH50578.1 hypothetical protein TKS_38100 [Burkholderia pseudomallei]BEH60643.1 hypothetical protein BpKM390_18880 [Burkholderia pseudomallei]BEH62687.1 hypothetical protein BpKM390_39320 [Burkholderia pseudomallei]
MNGLPRRPARVYAGRGYDHGKYRRIPHERNIPTSIARRGHPHGSGLEKPVGSSSVLMLGCIISATYVFAFERRADIHEAFPKLGCCPISWNTLWQAQQSL